MAALQEITESVLRQVEQVTGVPVIVNSDPALPLLASMKMARGTAPAHVISYNPRTTNVDYAVCYQCGFILRVAATPKDQRFDVAGTYRGRKDTEKAVTEHFQQTGRSIPKERREQFRDQIYDGLIRQLRSVPVGLRVDAWLGQEYPGLIDQQRAMISRQLQDNNVVLGPDIRAATPAKVYTANVTMNAAFAAYWSRKWSDPAFVTPYTVSGFSSAGQELLRIFDETPDAPTQDRELIRAWGQHLGLNGWFEFVPFQQN